MTPTVIIDTQSEPGSWALALATPCGFRTITEHATFSCTAPQDEPSPRRRAGRHQRPKTGGGGIGVCGPLHGEKVRLIAALVHSINRPRPDAARAGGEALTEDSGADAAAKKGG